MRQTLNSWFTRYLGDEEAVLLSVFILASLLVIWFLGSVLAPFLVSLVIAYILQGPMHWMVERGIPRLWALAMTYLFFIGLNIALIFILVPLILGEVSSVITELPAIANRGEQAIRNLLESSSGYFSDELLSATFSQMNQLAITNGEKLLAYSFGRIPGLMTLTVYSALVLILVFFLLKDWYSLGLGIKSFLPTRRGAMRVIWAEMDMQLANYLRGKALEIVIVGVVSYVVFALFGLRYSLLLAVIVGFSVMIPFVGAFAVTVPVALVALFQWGVSATTLYLIVAYIFLQILDGNVLVPMLFSEVVNLHPVFIILAILVFGGIWGVWGIFFAIPLATLIKALITAWPVHHPEQMELGETDK